ncbi:hypothetical protein [Streptomyces tateyamensis]|uniref:hypothetical protein n=1 Tax=Streptomyces tateyamensis TaxID=565073 RepID=UPI0011B64DE5|nr:hypothetical protein [Streptomyces tateyamensis]
MSDTTPEANDHGPAQSQLSPELAAKLGLTPTPEGTAPALIPFDQVKPEDRAKLAIEYRNGEPVIVVSGGTVFPAVIETVDTSGAPIGAYKAAAAARWRLAGPNPLAGENCDANGNWIPPRDRPGYGSGV